MQKVAILLITLLCASPVLAQERNDYSGKRADIEAIVAGKQCRSDGDVLRFGTLERGIGRFDHTGMAAATYALGYGTLMIERAGAVHGHVVNVQKSNGLFYLGNKAYACE